MVSEDRNKNSCVQQTYKFERQLAGGIVWYALNMYPTTNKLLLNGKDIDPLMHGHLPIVHEIIFKPIHDV